MLTFSPDDTHLAIAYEGVLEIYDINSGEPATSVLAEVSERPIRRLQFASDGRHVAAMDSNGVAHVIRVNGEVVGSFGHETFLNSDIDIDPSGVHVCSFSGKLDARRLDDLGHSVLVSDRLQARAGAFAADGESIVMLIEGDDTNHLVRIDAASGQKMDEVPLPGVHTHFATIRRDPATPGYLLHNTDGVRILSHDLRIESFVKDYDPGGLGIEADPDGRFFVLSGGDLRIFDRQTSRLTQRLTVDSRPHRAMDAAALSSDGQMLAVSGAHEVRLVPLDEAVKFAPGLAPITLAGANDNVDAYREQEPHGA